MGCAPDSERSMMARRRWPKPIFLRNGAPGCRGPVPKPKGVGRFAESSVVHDSPAMENRIHRTRDRPQANSRRRSGNNGTNTTYRKRPMKILVVDDHPLIH